MDPYLQIRTEGIIAHRARLAMRLTGIITAVSFGILNVMWLEAEHFCKLNIETAAREGNVPEDNPNL